MDFELSSEQQMLRDNVSRLMKDRYGFEARKTHQAAPVGFGEALWREYADMGLLGAPFSEEDGGFGGGPVETMIVMEEFGKALALEPYLETVVTCGALVKHAAAAEKRGELVGQSRRVICASASPTPNGRRDLISTTSGCPQRRMAPPFASTARRGSWPMGTARMR